ncbi:MAG: hypothetical protein AAF998_04835 [Bacteroidota bacterium]
MAPFSAPLPLFSRPFSERAGAAQNLGCTLQNELRGTKNLRSQISQTNFKPPPNSTFSDLHFCPNFLSCVFATRDKGDREEYAVISSEAAFPAPYGTARDRYLSIAISSLLPGALPKTGGVFLP